MKDFVKKASQKIDKLSNEQVEKLIETLSNKNEMLDSVIESLSTGLIILDKEWCVIKANKAANRFLPVKNSLRDPKSIGVFISDLIEEKDIRAFLCKCKTNKESHAQDEFSIASEEKSRFITVTISPLVKKKCMCGYIISVDDITEKRQQEILLHRMESLASLTNLAASVAHEIKNPLGAISIHIQLLQRAISKARNHDNMLPEPKFMENYLSVVNEEIDNLNKIVLDFLFAVRPVQANMSLSNPDELVSKFVDFFKPEFEAKRVSLEYNLCNTDNRVLIDEKLFREVITNIMQNGLQAILLKYPVKIQDLSGESAVDDEQTNQLDIQRERGKLYIKSFVKKDFYYLLISDNGCGMEENVASRIFEPYYTTKANGTGLGLTMVYKIIKEFRGDIDVKSIVNKGTLFTIKLPVPQKGTKLLEQKGECDR